MNTAFEITNLSYRYPGSLSNVLDKVSFSTPDSGATALLGPNGSGKTTLLELLLRFKTPFEGAITLFGKKSQEYSKKSFAQLVSLVPQLEVSRFSFSVLEQVLFGRTPYIDALATPSQEDVEIAWLALKRTNIEHLAQRRVAALSAGEQQLALLARSLAQQPRILLLDEPTSSLDPANVALVLSLLKELKQEGMGLIFSTHDPSLAAELADRAVMLKKGELLFHGEIQMAMEDKLLSHLYATKMRTYTIEGRIVVVRS
ncbi:MAG: ABC transporter ATP-binding protein [Sphaerochaetaceae bacterium]